MERKVKYDYAFKYECVELVLKHHYSIKSISIQKGPCESNILKWVLLYRTYGKTGLLSRKNQDYSVDFK
jgi:transposase